MYFWCICWEEGDHVLLLSHHELRVPYLFLSSTAGVIYHLCALGALLVLSFLVFPFFSSTWLHALAYKHFGPIYAPLYSDLPYLLHILLGILGQGSGTFSALIEYHPAIWAVCGGFITRPKASMKDKEDRKREMFSE